ncbi:MAG: restriction endonuclease subunit S [Microcystis wesenbergii Mw_QC_B_20070930_S4]|jgi:type I restriction enzyme S subunit|nr:MAG: restriction endonuclease subunit S [Microcystis wesenbergii Mw_QC_B_20070930_S4D]TRV14093.1 MAG: restriction endonuclease subunit S [Microcystis wesenbergii Mw_QC_B_20070930_S4]
MKESTVFPILPLGKICILHSGGTPRRSNNKYYGGNIPWAKIADLDTENGIVVDTEEYITVEGLQAINNRIFPKGSILLAMYGSIGKLAIAGRDISCNQAILGIQIKDKEHLDINYLRLWLTSIRATLEFQGRGVTQQNISKSIVEKLEIPLPPLEEQRRIAAILDKADGVRRKRKEAIRLTEELLKSTFLEMFGDPVTNPKGWEIAKLGDFGKILTGNTPPRSVSENYGDEIEWIKSDNITTPEHFLTEAEEKLSAKGKKIARTVPNGSILVTCIAGSRSSIGRAALTDREVAFNQQINAVVPNSDVDPYFLYGQLFVAQHLVQAQSTDSMKGMVNKSKFSSIEFIKPPSQKQQKFGKWFLGFHRYYMNLIGGEEQSENLFNSLLQRAFRGEL